MIFYRARSVTIIKTCVVEIKLTEGIQKGLGVLGLIFSILEQIPRLPIQLDRVSKIHPIKAVVVTMQDARFEYKKARAPQRYDRFYY